MKFIQKAYTGINEWYAYVLTLMLFVFGWQIVGVIPLVLVAYMKAGDMTTFSESAANNFADLGIDSNLYLVLIICTFAFGLLGLLLGIKLFHKRTIKSAVTSREKMDWGRVFYAFRVWFAFGIIMFGVSYFMKPDELVWNFNAVPFLILVLVSFLLLPIQTTMEEVLFRGYLMQGFGTAFKSTLPALLFTSVIFGLLHGMNPEVDKIGNIAFVYYIGTGLVLGIMTLMDEGTELAIGFHASNNILAAVLVTTDWTVFQTDALFVDTSEPSLGLDMFIPVFVLYPIILFMFSKKYGWTNWKEKLNGVVRKPVVHNEDQFIA